MDNNYDSKDEAIKPEHKLTKQEKIMQTREQAVFALLGTIGEDPEREGLLKTPNRVARMYEEIFAGYKQDPIALLSTTFDIADHQDMVIVHDIPFFSCCEHHMVPFYGTADIGYIPNKRVVGISKLARVVDCYAKRLQIQERLTYQVADAIEQVLNPLGVAVVLHAQHMCMAMRGVEKPGSITTTATMRGLFKLDDKARQEFNSYIQK